MVLDLGVFESKNLKWKLYTSEVLNLAQPRVTSYNLSHGAIIYNLLGGGGHNGNERPIWFALNSFCLLCDVVPRLEMHVLFSPQLSLIQKDLKFQKDECKSQNSGCNIGKQEHKSVHKINFLYPSLNWNQFTLIQPAVFKVFLHTALLRFKKWRSITFKYHSVYFSRWATT